MEVYIEYALLENFIIDCILLLVTRYEWSMPVRPLKTALTAAGGALFAVCYPLLSLPIWCGYVLKISGGLLLGLLGSDKKGWIRFSLTLLCNTALLGGMVYAAYGIFSLPAAEGVPIGLISACALLFVCGVCVGGQALKRHWKGKRFLYACTLTLRGNTVKTNGFLDTGNDVRFCGEPVHILSRKKALALWGENLFSAHTERESVFIRTAGGTTEIPVFRIDRLEIYYEGKRNIIEQAVIGLAPVELGAGYDLLLHPDVLIGGKHETFALTEILPREILH